MLAHFRIESKLGAGGMGVVYRAYDLRLERNVALKVLPAGDLDDPERRRWLLREARAASALNHSNIVTVFEVGSEGGVDFISMEYVEGSSLSEAIPAKGLPVARALDYAIGIAGALEKAHAAGVVHRDLKPANVMLTAEGQIKLLDFGLARRAPLGPAETATLSRVGEISGTIGYMSPEQLRGLPVTPRADLFSFGVVLYEMVTGERPFTGDSGMAVCDAVLHAAPRGFGDVKLPAKLKAIIRKLLEKEPANRYPSAGDVQQELKALVSSLAPARSVSLSRNAWMAVTAAVLLACIAGGWLWRKASRQRWALETAAPEIVRLIDSGEYEKAAALTRTARAVLPKDPAIEKLWYRATGEVSITTDPSGADVWFRPYRGDPNAWTVLGKTPLEKVRVALDAYVWKVAKPGFAGIVFLGEPAESDLPPGYHAGFSLNFKLRPATGLPPEMVFVPGAMVGLGYPLIQAARVQIGPFLIDRHEVTNEEYKRFVDAGGYQKPDLWRQPFIKDGDTIPWEQAIALFHDTTGRPGPATWEVGDYPKGRGKHPVAGVSWYEAAAYAEFVGKSLPTAYHWTRASQSVNFTPVITPGSNFQGEGTWPVGRESALSGFGTSDMAGNVKEWCWNETRDAKRLIMGGGFGEPSYIFNQTDPRSPWERLPNFGFRCMKLDSPASVTATARIEVTTRDFRKDKPVSDDVFKAYASAYDYDKGELNAQVDERVVAGAWTREKVSFDAAYGRERVPAYLYLPKNASPPLQVVVYYPGGFAYTDDKLDLEGLEETRGFLVKSGRALILPIYKGTYVRKDGFKIAAPPAAWRDHEVAWAKDVGRSLDYLETRKDIDATKVAYMGDSVGAILGALLPAVERRIQTAILVSGGFQLTIPHLPDGDPFNFVRHVTIPVLMVNGRYDTSFPLESAQRPLFEFLGAAAKDKKHLIYEGGHGVFPRPDAVRECLDWLDRYLGPVRH
jgi:dienelactone hydrolase/predicted Ser/Thr protein kinase